jgi:hypothetical protein
MDAEQIEALRQARDGGIFYSVLPVGRYFHGAIYFAALRRYTICCRKEHRDPHVALRCAQDKADAAIVAMLPPEPEQTTITEEPSR